MPAPSGLNLLGGLVHGAVRVEPDVTVRVHQPGQDPASTQASCEVQGVRLRLAGDAAAGDVELSVLSFGEDDSAHPQDLAHTPRR